MLDNLKFWKKKAEPDMPGTPFPSSDPLAKSDNPFAQNNPTNNSNPFNQDPFQQSQDPFNPNNVTPRPPGGFGSEPKDDFNMSVGASPKPSGHGRDMEMVHLKLDAIKNTLESINLRLERLEDAAGIRK